MLSRPVEAVLFGTFYLLLCALAAPAVFSAEPDDAAQAARDRLVSESLLRLKDVDIAGNAKLEGSVLRHALSIRAQDNYFLLAQRFRIPDLDADLFQLATTRARSTEGVRAAQVLSAAGQLSRLFQAASGADIPVAIGAVTVLGELDDPMIVPVLIRLVPAKNIPRPVRARAVYSLGKTRAGQERLLGLVEDALLPGDLKVSAANVLLGSRNDTIRGKAGKYLSLPATADATPLPPIPALLAMKGDRARGEIVFQKVGTCIQCHRVSGKGKEVGPDLTEIGSKLAPEAMIVSILDPSAGISHNYETHNIVLNSGNVLSGILVTKTPDSITIKTVEAIEKTVAVADIEEMVKSNVSLMPADLQKALTAKDLVDLLDYLSSLKKVAP